MSNSPPIIGKEEVVKYPRFTRAQSLSAKLCEEQISEIKKWRYRGYTYAAIAHAFNVSPSTVWRVCLSEEERKQLEKRHYKAYHKQRTVPKDQKAKWRKRKKELQQKDLTRYNTFQRKQWEIVHKA